MQRKSPLQTLYPALDERSLFWIYALYWQWYRPWFIPGDCSSGILHPKEDSKEDGEQSSFPVLHFHHRSFPSKYNACYFGRRYGPDPAVFIIWKVAPSVCVNCNRSRTGRYDPPNSPVSRFPHSIEQYERTDPACNRRSQSGIVNFVNSHWVLR